MASGEVSEEEPIAQRLAQAIRYEINHLKQVEGTKWQAGIVTPKKASEKHHGADLGVFVEIDLAEDDRGPAYRTKKSLLVQAKRDDRLSQEMPHLREQVEKMADLSDAAAVVILGEDFVGALDASEVDVGVSAGDLRADARAVPELFRAFLRCQVGDRTWGSPKELRDALESHVVHLVGHQRYRRRGSMRTPRF